MRFILSVFLVAFLSALVEYFMPWWSCAVVCFLVALFLRYKDGRSFLLGFLGVGLFWLVASLMHDISNEHILSTRMAALFKLPGYGAFIGVTVFIGGLVGGLAAWAGSLLVPKST